MIGGVQQKRRQNRFHQLSRNVSQNHRWVKPNLEKLVNLISQKSVCLLAKLISDSPNFHTVNKFWKHTQKINHIYHVFINFKAAFDKNWTRVLKTSIIVKFVQHSDEKHFGKSIWKTKLTLSERQGELQMELFFNNLEGINENGMVNEIKTQLFHATDRDWGRH